MTFVVRFSTLLSTRQDLPALPEGVLRLRTLLRREDVPASAINDVLTRDPALAGRVLRAANSACFARATGGIASIEAATMRLGLRRVASLCLAVDTIRIFGVSRHLDHQQFWTHSHAVGSVASALATRTGEGDPSDMFIAGLMHDVGLLFLEQFLPEDYLAVSAAGIGQTRWRLEEELLEMEHGAMGGMLLSRWGLPPVVVEAVTRHHRPFGDAGPGSAAALLLAAAEGLVGEYGLGLPEEGPSDPDADAAFEALGLSAAEASDLRVSLAGVSMEAADLLRAAA